MDMDAIASMTPEQMEALASSAFSVDLGMQLGPILMGCMFDAILWGVMLQQFQGWWEYCRASERSTARQLTYYIMIASTAWTAMVISYAMHSFVYMFGQYIVFLEMPYFTSFPIVGLAMSAPIQAFYAERSYRLNNRNIFLLMILIACILGELAAVTVLVIKCTNVPNLLFAAEAVPQVRAWQCMTLATDILITISIGWGLWSAQTGWSHTDALVKKLLLITLETQLAPTLLMLGFVIEMSISPSSTIGVFFDLCIPKAYTVGYLATLNVRVQLKRAQTSQSGDEQTRSNAYHLGSGRSQQATVQIETDTYTESFQMQNAKAGLNRIKEDSYDESIENLDYSNNLSKQNLNKQS
ncbi:uncharacterized protein I206_104789 [Kwoniella pini CBS 10737]|uniref:DUF6534 domain-containing protein n=1 Tax=Kwoniella pini CBS 10737 TaxID=1296096 RepID=A0A1B9I7X9_9TREE|nr:uncharacterized protein I206_02328 [Kwoniella pini CBS 10737]OCF51613.1 hypothetical protein I206_02328 [Kwoniella pini CBS 10737]